MSENLLFDKINRTKDIVSYRHVEKMSSETRKLLFGEGEIDYGHLSTSAVSKIESDLGVALNEDYKKLISEYGFLMYKGKTIYGIPPISVRKIEPVNFSVIESNRYFRSMNYFNLCGYISDSVIISEDSAGGFYILQGNGHVKYIEFSNSWITLDEWSSLFDFIDSYFFGE